MRRARIITRVGALVALAAAMPAPARGETLSPGCAPGRPAVAHRAGARVVAGVRVPVPCATETGQYTGETGIGVAGDGTVWFSAADWEWALARTRDLGARWERYAVPGPQAYPGCQGGTGAAQPCDQPSESAKYNTVADAYLHVDRDTSRVFWAKTYGYALCSSLSYSDDGEQWHATTPAGCPGGDYEKVATGPPPAGGEQPKGYRNVVYLCTNGPAPTFVVGPARVCFKSLDGGATFANAGVPAVPNPQAPGCLQFQEPQVVGRDGTVYLPLNCGAAGIKVAISRDEAASWTYATVPLGDAGNGAPFVGGVSMAVDDGGAIYVVWPGTDEKTRLAVSKDRGATWRGPYMVSPPGVTLAGEPAPQVAAREPGHVAIGSYGDTGDANRVNGYLTESFDADAAEPLFYSAQLNDPAQPLWFPTEGTNPRNDYLGVTIAPDGTPWTGLVKLLSPKPDDQGYVQSTGFAGRLTFAPYAAASASAPHTPGQAATAADLECARRGIVLTDVLETKRRVVLMGVAQSKLVGRRLRIVLTSTGRTVARPTVRPDGTFRTTAPLPAARVRASSRTRYRAVAGSSRSAALKLRRRLTIYDVAAKGRSVTITGRVAPPLARPARSVIVERRVSCTRTAFVGRATPRRNGRFSVTVAAPRSASAVVYRLRTVVLGARRHRLQRTFSLTPAVEVTP